MSNDAANAANERVVSLHEVLERSQQSPDGLDSFLGRHVRARRVRAEDWIRFEESVGEILTAFGMDLETTDT